MANGNGSEPTPAPAVPAYQEGPQAHQSGPHAYKGPMSSEEAMWLPERFTERLDRVRKPAQDSDPGMRDKAGGTEGSDSGEFQGQPWKMPDIGTDI